MRTRLLLIVTLLAALAVVTPGAAASGAARDTDDLEILALSNRADLVSGGDVLLEVRLPSLADVTRVRVDVNGRDATPAFAVRGDGRFLGLVEGLAVGTNTVTATAGATAARLEVTNHPIGGSVFSGPQIQPWYCLEGALDAQCNRPVTYAWSYKSTDGSFQPYDPENPPPAEDVAQTTTDEGNTVPYIVRQETGNMNRNQYRIAVLVDPNEPFTRWAGPPAWNHKVFMGHGAGCSMNHSEGSSPNVIRDFHLSRGFAVMSTALSDNTYSCNLAVQAESVMMAKEHLIESYGDVRYLIGAGCSGGSIATQSMANAYPGLYDGLTVGCSFPDVPVNDLLDCTVLLGYFDNPWAWSPGVVWSEPQQAAAAGLASTSVCHLWAKAYGYPQMFNPRSGVGCRIPQQEPEKVYHPVNNPTGVRCSFQDYLVNIFGLRPPSRWGPVEQEIGRGFANRPYDNVGVQYGLRALLSGDITPAQFVDLNAKAGGIDIDYGRQPERVEGDPDAIVAAYRSGVLNEANNLDRIPIIDIAGWIPADRYEIHDNYKSWGMRARLDAANGHHDNHVIWYSPDQWGLNVEGNAQAFLVMDEWLSAVERDQRDVQLSRKVVDNKPAGAVDRCEFFFFDRATCDAVFGPAANPRWGAGMPTLANDVIKCQLKPLVAADYYPILFTDAQWSRLQDAFPTGVCDWDARGVGQQDAIGWQTYEGGPGGEPLGASPQSEPGRRAPSTKPSRETK